MPRSPVRIKPGWLRPDLAERFPWRCAEHLAAGEKQCLTKCCGACYFLAPGAGGCQLGPMRPVRCKTYPLVPLGNKVIVHGKCPDAAHFQARLAEGDPRAVALLDVAVAMCDLVHQNADDNSEEVRWMMEYVEGGFTGPAVWTRRRGVVKARPAAG